MVATSGTEVKTAQIHYCHLLITDPLMIIFINCPPTKAWSKRDQNNEVIKEKYVYIQDATVHMENKIFCGLGLPSFGGGHNGHDISKEERNRCNTPSFFIPFSKGKLQDRSSLSYSTVTCNDHITVVQMSYQKDTLLF